MLLSKLSALCDLRVEKIFIQTDKFARNYCQAEEKQRGQEMPGWATGGSESKKK
jgi:hypothetical protein